MVARGYPGRYVAYKMAIKKTAKSLIQQLPEKYRKIVRQIYKRESGELTHLQNFRANLREWKGTVDRYSGKTHHEEMRENFGRNRNYTGEELDALIVANYLGFDLERRGIARRIINENPAELEKSLSLSARLKWINRGNRPSEIWVDIWHILNCALASGDTAVAIRNLETSVKQIRNGHKATVAIYKTVRAIMTESPSVQKKMVNNNDRLNLPECYRAVTCALRGIVDRDAEYLAQSLDYVLSTFRRFELQQHEQITCLIGHGIAELANWVSTELMSSFDTEQKIPWDAAYYRYLRRSNRSNNYLNVEKHSELLNTWINELPEPEWWLRNNY